MNNPASFEGMEQATDAVLDAETTHFLELVELMELDPKTDFSGADLSGCDFSSTDLRGVDFHNANLQDANFEVAPFFHSSAPFLSIERNLISIATLSRDIAEEISRFFVLDLDSNRARYRSQNLAWEVEDATTSARLLVNDFTLTRAQMLTNDLNVVRARAQLLVEDLTCALSNNLTPELTQAPVNDASRIISQISLAISYAHSSELVLSRRGADLSNADLSNADLSGAKVKGAIMTGCQGLSLEAVRDLKQRGAIFNDEERKFAPTLVAR